MRKKKKQIPKNSCQRLPDHDQCQNEPHKESLVKFETPEPAASVIDPDGSEAEAAASPLAEPPAEPAKPDAASDATAEQAPGSAAAEASAAATPSGEAGEGAMRSGEAAESG